MQEGGTTSEAGERSSRSVYQQESTRSGSTRRSLKECPAEAVTPPEFEEVRMIWISKDEEDMCNKPSRKSSTCGKRTPRSNLPDSQNELAKHGECNE